MPQNGLGAMALDGETAIQIVQNMPAWRRVPSWSAPELVVYQGSGDWTTPVLAWKFVGENPNPAAMFCRTFFVDATNGQLVHVRNEVVDADVAGSVQGWGSPGVFPDDTYNPPALLAMPDIRASISGGNNAYTNGLGQFLITHPGTSPVSVSAGVQGAGAGRWVNVFPTGVAALTTTESNVLPPGPANLIMNPAPAQGLTAQVNTFIGATLTHNYFKTYAPSFTGLDIAITANTGVSGTCNAFFSPGSNPPTSSSINFYNAGGGCVNTAFSTVISHEYGHFIVNRLGLSQNSFGEGYSDVVAQMIWDDDVTGRGFRGQGTFVRSPISANMQYPCSQAIHTCGQVLSGSWWRIRTNMGAFYGSQPGLEETRELQVAWSLITAGGPNSSNSAGPSTAIEVLTADDNDGNLNNGTPNYSRICPAFAAHSIQCPQIILLNFTYPNGRPVQLVPGQPAVVDVNITGNAASPQPGTGTVSYRIGGGAYTTVPMNETSPNQYTATLPAAECGSAVDYYFSAQTTSLLTASDPPTAPVASFSAVAASGLTTVVDLNFNTDPGWTVVNDPSLTSGAWERVTPTPGAGTGTPSSAQGGSGQCYVTDNRSGNFDVDGGPTVLLSSVYDLSTYPRITVSYNRWLYSSGSDPFTFEYSTNGGSSWTVLESVTGTTTASWEARSYDIASPTANMRFRWTISDNPNNSVAEGGVDSFSITGITCGGTCYANCDGSTATPVLNVNDFVCFQQRFAAGDPYANCDGSTTAPVLNVNDFVCFQQQFAAGCP
jgi:hypothetical protein